MSIAYKDYYAILGVARDATQEDIKKAFRKLARQYHPDVAKDKGAAEVKFKEINEAHEVLSDPDKRSRYDQLGADWERGGTAPPPGGDAGYGGYGAGGSGGGGGYSEQEFHFGGTGFSDFFEQYFSGATPFGFPPHGGGGAEEDFEAGSARRGGQPRPRRGSDVEGDILVTLEEAMHGTVRPLTLQMLNRRTGQAETRDFQVRIPPGATDGRRIRVPGQGEPGQNGGPDGDLFLRVRHAAHPDFTTEGADLYHELDIAPWEAVLGAEVVVPTLGGSVKLRIPAGSENGQNLRLRNRGLPKGKSGDHGDFFVVLKVALPPAPAGEERQLWEKLRDISTFRPRSNS
ncbi:MAG: J domain-containing protein [Verrucomicrobiaceae bacterium]|nr:MAG: J domain-containing protein [Verrucomicrobiaceae bacterium]